VYLCFCSSQQRFRLIFFASRWKRSTNFCNFFRMFFLLFLSQNCDFVFAHLPFKGNSFEWNGFEKNNFFLKYFFWCAPFGYLYFLYLIILNEPGLDAGIDPGMVLTPLPSSIGRWSIPRPSNRKPLDHSFRYEKK
jgi:hypothetical protein